MLDVSIAPAPAPDAPFEDHVDWARSAPAAPVTPATMPTDYTHSPVGDAITVDAQPWDYESEAHKAVSSSPHGVLDIGTGDGTVFAAMGPLPEGSAATSTGPAFLAARRTLEPLRVNVQKIEEVWAEDLVLPFFDGHFATVISRCGLISAHEVARLLQPGGVFVTEQFDTRDGYAINEALGVPVGWDPDGMTVDVLTDALQAEGMEITRAEHHAGVRRFRSLAAVLWYLRTVPWQVPDLAQLAPAAVRAHEAGLRGLHMRFAAGVELVDEAPRLFVTARKPG
ncbi:class I SAM-dependent methyltransferase [Myceligenerans salitolerans]|uniref:Class I SAM-dependent methyltransferase n=1 Tax=Myceligenerans salitolerans TaxID=1230528 RepID=A0ABS3I5F5_9MICO|nr:class I SAM-dependent methyltransferase [Myceligenerans salitolerans]MBO0608214.1 class I SAM-dependent methyltransferase [Myceligenerans salitolerans]